MLRKLTVEFGAWEECSKVEFLCELDQVASILVKFEELDLSKDEDVSFTHAVMGALLKALSEEGSKLKILTIFSLEMFVPYVGPYFTESVDKLRQAGVTVDVIWSEHWDYSEYHESD